MKSSKYNFITTYPATREKLLFNTLTTAFIALSTDAYVKVSAVLTDPMGGHDSSLVNYLHKNGFLVDVNKDEFQIVQDRSALGIHDNNRVDLIVMPNMNCNFACTYCYEEHTKSSMSDETARRLKIWLEHMAPRFKAVLLSWFGGEPMLSYKRIVEIQSHAHRLTKDHGTELISHMTTNGYALLPEKAKTLTSLGLHSFQITLDGPAETHNLNRPLKKGGASFDRIFSNICSLARTDPRVNIKLRVNYDCRNIDRVPELLESIPQDIRSQIDLVLERIFGENYGNYSNESMNIEQAKAEHIYALGLSMGYTSTTPQLVPDKLTYCYADRKNQFLVNYNGDIYKCTVGNFDSSRRMGWLNEQGTISWEGDGERVNAWHATPAFEEKCSLCIYAPMCLGGCRKMRHYTGSVGDDCTIHFLGLDERLHNYYTAKRNGIDIAKPQ
ncbi:MAG: radical SAM protein [Candidatus Nitrotoga sp.]